MQAMPQTRMEIVASEKWYQANGDDAQPMAESIVRQYEGAISQFYRAQEHNYNAGIAPVVSAEWTINGYIKLQYQNVQGSPILTVTVFPQNNAPQPQGSSVLDMNYDGYIAWLHNEANFNDSNPTDVSGPYDVFLNGYLVLSNQKITCMNPIFLIMFGTTALQLHSLHDNQNPLKLSQPIAPARTKIKATSGAYGSTIPEHADMPGYFVLDWGDQLNPDLFAYDADATIKTFLTYIGTTSPTQTWDQYTNTFATITSKPGAQIIGGIQFADPTKSPLNSHGYNTLTIQPHAGGLQGPTGYNQSFDFFLAEFFDRKSLRIVNSTPKYPPIVGRQVTTNDKPLLWAGYTQNPVLDGTSSTYIGNGTGTLKMDLTPADAYPLASALGEAPTGQLTYVAPTTGMETAWSSYSTAYQAYITAEEAYAASNAAATAAYAPAVAAWNGVPPPTNYYLDTLVLADGGTAWSLGDPPALDTPSQALVRAYLNSLTALDDATASNVSTAAAAFVAAVNAMTAYDTSKFPRNIAYNTRVANGAAAYAAATVTYLLATHTIPPIPPAVTFSSAGAQSINAFKYRTVTVTNGEFAFGDWQNA
jgi:hypothetical protein